MAARITYMGDMCNNHIDSATTSGIHIFFRVTPADLPKPSKGAAMSATTAGRIPLEDTLNHRVLLKLGETMAMSRMAMKEGRMDAGSRKKTSFKTKSFVSHKESRI